MKTSFLKPDFNANIINISATLAEFLGCPNDKPTLPALEAELKKGYKNVVFLILDGLGSHPIAADLPETAFLRRNIRQTLTSVFPSTTTNATTTFLTNKYPMEHGWFGWSLYFEGLGQVVNLFPETDSFTWEPVEYGYVKKVLPTEPYFKRAKGKRAVSVVVPEFWHGDEENKHIFTTFEEMYGLIEEICKRAGEQFIYAYCPEPDSAMHRFGVSSAEARQVIGALNAGAERLCGRLSDTLFIVTADHGQIDVGENIELYRDRELLSLLEWPPYLEPRAAAFKVKKECKEKFTEMFARKYGNDFELVESEKLIRENYFGGYPGAEHGRFLGDFIAIGTTDKMLKLSPRSHDFKGHHTSLTREEMLVPLIYVGIG